MIKPNFDTIEALEKAENLFDGPTLDPSIPIFFVINGNRQQLPVHKVLGCGGLATDTEKFDEILGSFDRPYPSTLEAVTFTTRQGQSVEIYASQHIFIAPIASRRCWYDSEARKTHQKYIPGTRNWQQMLALMGEKLGDEYISWGPICLSLKGYQVKFLQHAVREWGKYTRQMRVELTHALHANGAWRDQRLVLPERLFWMPIGTFGTEPKIEMVGTKAQSPITPIRTYTVKGALNVKQLEALYVGDDVVVQAGELLETHHEWLNAWKEQGTENEIPTKNTDSEPEGDSRQIDDSVFPGI